MLSCPEQGKLGEAERLQLLAFAICERRERPVPGVTAYGLDKAKMLRGMGIIKLFQANNAWVCTLVASLLHL